jgi:ribose transport system substrate-binding protein
VVIVDTRLDSKAAGDANIRTVSFVGSDNYRGGQLIGEYLNKVSGGNAKVAILEGIPGHDTGDQRVRGFRDAIKGTPGVEVLASQTANWERDQGFTVFQNMLQANPAIDSVFACNDMMALGAIEAIAAAGKTGKIRVLGFDAVDDARKAIEAGTMLATVAQYPDEMGRVAVEAAVKAIKGETVPQETNVRIGLVTK